LVVKPTALPCSLLAKTSCVKLRLSETEIADGFSGSSVSSQPENIVVTARQAAIAATFLKLNLNFNMLLFNLSTNYTNYHEFIMNYEG